MLGRKKNAARNGRVVMAGLPDASGFVMADANGIPLPAVKRTNRIVAGTKVQWRYRHGLAPVYAGVATYLAGWICRKVGADLGLIAAGGVVVAAVAWAATRKWLDRSIERSYTQLLILAAGVWLVVATAFGLGWELFEVSWTAWLISAGGVLSLPWWHHFRYRMEATPPPEVHVLDYFWQAGMGRTFGGSRIVNERKTEFGYEGDIVGVPGQHTYTKFVQATELIASAFEASITDVVVDSPASGRANRARLAWYDGGHPLHAPLIWPGIDMFDPLTGIATIGRYDDGTPVAYQLYRESGPVHDLISGTTDSGKSRFVDQCLAIERHASWVSDTDVKDPETGEMIPAGQPIGLFHSYVIDPQGGQSLPDWQEDVAGYAKSAEDGLVLLGALHSEMHELNNYLSQVEWVDEKGRPRKGSKAFNPLAGPTKGMRVISITVEEAHKICNTPIGRYLLEDIAKMARKCGIRLRLVTQVPLLDQLGNSATLRDQLTGGNVVVFRTGSSISSRVVLGGILPVDPHSLPRAWPDKTTTAGLGFVLGPDARPAQMRTYYLPDPYDYVEMGETSVHKPKSDALAKALATHAETGMFGADTPEIAAATAAAARIPHQAGSVVVAKENRAKPGEVETAIRDLMADGKERSRGEILSETGASTRTVNAVLRHMVEEERSLVKPSEGRYLNPEAAFEYADPASI